MDAKREGNVRRKQTILKTKNYYFLVAILLPKLLMD